MAMRLFEPGQPPLMIEEIERLGQSRIPGKRVGGSRIVHVEIHKPGMRRPVTRTISVRT